MRGRIGAVARVDLSPLIDMVFILLIFFVVAAVFVEERGLALATPSSVGPPPDGPKPLLIEVGANGAVLHGGEEIGLMGARALVRREKGLAERPVLLVVASEASAEKMVSVMDACLEEGAERVLVKGTEAGERD